MVKKHFCDRCGNELNKSFDEFDELFNDVSSGFGKKSLITNPDLCNKCEKGYEKIINETNKKISGYLKQ